MVIVSLGIEKRQLITVMLGFQAEKMQILMVILSL